MDGIMKTLRLFSVAALAASAAILGACSIEQQPDKDIQNKVSLIATISPKAASTRQLSDPGDGTIASDWAVGEEIWVYYNNTANEYVETMATVTAVGADGSAIISATLADPVSCNASFGYPFSCYTLNGGKDIFQDQLGTLEDVSSNFDIIFGAGDIVVDGTTATLPTGVEMEHETSIWRLSFTDGSSDITSSITQLVVSDSGSDYVVTPSGLSTIYVSTYPMADSDVTITATTASGEFSVTKSGITLDPGKVYTSKSVALASTASLDPIKQAEALQVNTYSIQKTGEAAQVFSFQQEYSQWYIGPSWMDSAYEALHVELMDEDPQEATMGWFSGEFPPSVAGQLTTVDEDFFSEFSWASAKVGTMRLGKDKMIDVHMAKGGNVKLKGCSQFLIKPKVGTKSYSGEYQFLFVFVFDNWTWDQQTESYIPGDEYTMCGNAILNELIAELSYFSLEGGYGAWLAPGQTLKLTAQWTAGAKFDWSKVTLDSQTCNGSSGEWFTWDSSTQTLYAKNSADNKAVNLTFGYSGTDMTYNMTVYSGPGYNSFRIKPENSSADFVLVENDPAYGWSSDTIWFTGDEWAPDNGGSFNFHSIEIDPSSGNYDKLDYNDYGPYVNFKKGIPEGDFNLIFHSKANPVVKFTIPVKVVKHKVQSFKITYKHSNGVFEPWTSGGENGVCNYPMGMELGVITDPEDAYWDWSHVELSPGYDNEFSFSGYGGRDDHPKLMLKTSHDGNHYGTQVIFRLKWNNKKTSEIYVDHN